MIQKRTGLWKDLRVGEVPSGGTPSMKIRFPAQAKLERGTLDLAWAGPAPGPPLFGQTDV